MSAIPPGQGLAMIKAEMARQHADALASFHANRVRAAEIAASVRRTGRLVLTAMGGSHWVNRAAAVLYRRAGVDVSAEVLSELLITPLPDQPRTLLITSQSGASGEVVALLNQPAGRTERFGITLEPAAPLGSRVPSMVAAGGSEKAFAATRSILLCHALHLALLGEFGVDPAPALAVLHAPPLPAIDAALAALRPVSALVLSGRAELQGVAETGALCIMETACIPGLALEGGQLRHGPMEMLSPSTGIVLLRGAGAHAALAPGLAAACRSAGAPVVVFDASGETGIEGCTTLSFPRLDGMAAILATIPVLQTLLLALAGTKVAHVGEPLRTSKVTVEM